MTENVENQKFTKLEEKFMSKSNTAFAKTFVATLFGILLCSFGPFGLFAPAAFAFSYLNGPMKKTFLIQLVVFTVALIAFGKGFFLEVVASGIYATLIGFGIGFSIKNKIPQRHFLLNTGSVLVGGLVYSSILVALSDQSVYEIYLLKRILYRPVEK